MMFHDKCTRLLLLIFSFFNKTDFRIVELKSEKQMYSCSVKSFLNHRIPNTLISNIKLFIKMYMWIFNCNLKFCLLSFLLCVSVGLRICVRVSVRKIHRQFHIHMYDQSKKLIKQHIPIVNRCANVYYKVPNSHVYFSGCDVMILKKTYLYYMFCKTKNMTQRIETIPWKLSKPIYIWTSGSVY